MSSPDDRTSIFVSKFPRHAWWILLLAALALLWTASNRRSDRVIALSDMPTWSADAPKRDIDTRTGYEKDQRYLVVPGHHNSSFAWITEAQESSADNSSLDDSTRTSLYRYWLRFCGRIHNLTNDGSLGYSIGQATLFADPLLLTFLLLGGSLYCARFIGSFAASGFVIAGACLFPLSSNFQPGAPDSHSLAWVLALGSVLPLLISKAKANASLKGHFILAGVFGGLGFWNDTDTQSSLFLAIGAAAIAYTFIRESSSDTPLPWRTWAWAGSIITLIACVIEGAALNWELDALSPVYAIAWIGFGELLTLLSKWKSEPNFSIKGKGLIFLAVGLLALASWPIAGILTESGSLLANDFYARELANHPDGGLAANLGAWTGKANGGAKAAALLPLGLVAMISIQLFTGKLAPELKSRLSFVFVASLFVLALSFLQIRWLNLFDILAMCMLAMLFEVKAEKGERLSLSTAVYSLLVIPGLIIGFPSAVKAGEPLTLTPTERQSLVERDYAYWLNLRAGKDPVVLYSAPIFSTGAGYYGGFETIITSEHMEGTRYETAVRIASANTEQEISILLEDRNVTHIALPLWDPTLEQFVRRGSNTAANEPLPPAAFLVSLMSWDLPAWIRPLNYPSSPSSEFKGFNIPSFALTSEQEPEQSLSRIAGIFVENAMPREARSIRAALESFPRDVNALAAIANIDYALGEKKQLEETLEKLIPYLSRRSARNLPVDTRINLASLFTRTKRIELAKDQLAKSMENLDTETLRLLTPNTVASLILLSRSLDLAFPDEATAKLANDLLPPDIREQLAKATQ